LNNPYVQEGLKVINDTIRTPDRRITGVDFLPRNIERARACARQAGLGEDVQFVCRDLYEWAPEGKYDVLLSFDALEHIDGPKAFLQK